MKNRKSSTTPTGNKIRQHYIPKFYLDLWLEKKGELHTVKNVDGKILHFVKKTTRDVAVERYFYNIEMDSTAWNALKLMFEKKSLVNPFVKKVLEKTFFFAAADDVFNKGLGITQPNQKLLKQGQEDLKTLRRHYLEDGFSKIEAAISLELYKLMSYKEHDPLSHPTAATFQHMLMFYTFQVFRTPHMEEQIKKHVSSIILRHENGEVVLTEPQKQAVLKCALFISSQELYNYFENAGCALSIGINRTELDFITSDRPAMYFDENNILPDYRSFGVMPLSPNHIMYVRIPREPLGGGKLSINYINDAREVEHVNRLIRSQAFNNLFSTQPFC